jgi:hypothetical protein
MLGAHLCSCPHQTARMHPCFSTPSSKKNNGLTQMRPQRKCVQATTTEQAPPSCPSCLRKQRERCGAHGLNPLPTSTVSDGHTREWCGTCMGARQAECSQSCQRPSRRRRGGRSRAGWLSCSPQLSRTGCSRRRPAWGPCSVWAAHPAPAPPGSRFWAPAAMRT